MCIEIVASIYLEYGIIRIFHTGELFLISMQFCLRNHLYTSNNSNIPTSRDNQQAQIYNRRCWFSNNSHILTNLRTRRGTQWAEGGQPAPFYLISHLFQYTLFKNQPSPFFRIPKLIIFQYPFFIPFIALYNTSSRIMEITKKCMFSTKIDNDYKYASTIYIDNIKGLCAISFPLSIPP